MQTAMMIGALTNSIKVGHQGFEDYVCLFWWLEQAV